MAYPYPHETDVSYSYWKNKMTIILSPNFTAGRKLKIKAIVLHITGSASSSAINTFLNPASQASAHYLVKEDGEVVQMVKESDRAWHAGRVVSPTWKGIINGISPNDYTIGIETALVTGKTLPPWKQWIAVRRLIKDIKTRYPDVELVHHNEIIATKECPGWYITRFYMNLLTPFI